jgi:transcriptional regulator with XRE-family HTH domain
MTPFGARLRELRAERGVTQAQMARDLMISGAYLSALEHGRRGVPSDGLLHQICDYFDIIWDEAEALKALAAASHPRVLVDTAGLTPAHTALANALARRIRAMSEAEAAALRRQVEGAAP